MAAQPRSAGGSPAEVALRNKLGKMLA